MITTVIFDFAGVVSVGRLFPVIAKNLSEQFGIDEVVIKERLYGNEKQFLLGRETVEDFWKRVCDGLSIPLREFEEAFRKWELNEETVTLIRELKKKYSVVLLSDNFAPTSAFIRSHPIFNELFDKMYFSNEVHMIKNDPGFFQYALDDLKIKPQECVFIDDQEKNLIAPRELGIQCILFTDAEQTRKEIYG